MSGTTRVSGAAEPEIVTAPLRIAVGGIHTESSTYNPVPTRLDDFRVLRGADLSAAAPFDALPRDGVDLLALLHARAVPGGPVSRDAYAALKAEFLERLGAALPVDGLYLALHGAMNVEGLDDAEGDWIAAARAVVGESCVVAASYDLHGNVSQAVIDGLDIFAAYRTAPHVDVGATHLRAWSMLVEALRTGRRPGLAWAPVPLLLPGECTSTQNEPARGLYAGLAAHDARPGVLDANLMIGYVWADEPRATAAAVVTGSDRAAAEAAAAAIAAAYWASRERFGFGSVTGPLDAMLDRAEACTTRPVILADSGDNPTGGGVGDRADVLRALLSRRWTDALVAGIADAPAVDVCFAAGVDAEVVLDIGGSLDGASVPVAVRARVLRLDDPGTPRDRQAVVHVDGVDVVLAARRRPYHDDADFRRLGLDPAGVRLLVVKSGYLSPDLARLANPNLMALTDGVVSQDIPNLANRRRSGPVFPFNRDLDVLPGVRASRRWRADPGSTPRGAAGRGAASSTARTGERP